MFLRLSDVASGLPPYQEQVLLSGMDREPDHTGLPQRKAYDVVFDTLRQALAEAWAKGSKRLLATYLQTLLAYPGTCTRGETAFDPRTGNVRRCRPVRGQALSERAILGGPGGSGKAGGPQGTGLRHPHRNAGHHRADGAA